LKPFRTSTSFSLRNKSDRKKPMRPFFSFHPNLLLLGWFLFVLSSCNVYRDVQVNEVQEIIVGEISEEGMQVEVRMTIENPNWYNVVLKKSHVDVFLEGSKIGELVLNEKVTVPKKSTTTQVLVMDADYEKLQGIFGNILILLFKKEYILEAKGFVTGRGLIVTKKVKVDLKETLSREDLGF